MVDDYTSTTSTTTAEISNCSDDGVCRWRLFARQLAIDYLVDDDFEPNRWKFYSIGCRRTSVLVEETSGDSMAVPR